MTTSSTAGETLELVFFRVGASQFGAELTQVIRVDSPDGESLRSTVLGLPTAGRRALVSQLGPGTEQALVVDVVEGVRRVERKAVRRLPKLVVRHRALIGAWLNDDGHPVLLVDLHAL